MDGPVESLARSGAIACRSANGTAVSRTFVAYGTGRDHPEREK